MTRNLFNALRTAVLCAAAATLCSCGKSGGGNPAQSPGGGTTKTASAPSIINPVDNLSNGTRAPYVAAHDSIVSGGDVWSDGGAAVTARGVCWATSQNPTVADSRTSDGSGTGEFVSHITGLKVNTTYYLRAYATNSAGTGYSQQVSLTTAYVIGERFGGGTIFYVDSTKLHGLIVAQYARTASVWGANVSVGATSMFDGKANTDKIVARFGASAQNAAALCRACRDGGYSDWFLPALVQLELLGAAPVGDIDWSSTEYDSGNAYVLASPYQDNYAEAKSYKHPARPVRSF